ncbi:MAG: hypothetical protein JJU24_07780 [Natronohydrobacter sp.]|nr:hypothetical protein [Natronohydrobacter sp.]
MREVSEIRDADSLKAWLEALPQDTEAERDEARRWAVAIAHRAAMRVLPWFWEWSLGENARKRALTALPILQPSLIAAITVVCSTLEIKAAAKAAAFRNARAADTALDAPNAAAATGAADAAFGVRAAAALDNTYVARSAANAAARAAATAHAAGAIWELIRRDCAVLINGAALERRPLWDGDNPFASLWAEIRPRILAQSDGWRFWVDWYDNALHGRPQDYDLLTKIALIDPKDWDEGADHVNALIANIIRDHEPAQKNPSDKAAEIAADRLIRAAIGNFTFDAMAEVMRIVPFAEDIRFMRDADALKRVMDDVGAIRDEIETFADALAAEGTRRNAGAVSVYLKRVLSEFTRAEETGELRVGVLIRQGQALQTVCLDETSRAELAPFDKALDDLVNELLAVTHRHFASTFLRFEPLHALELGDDDPHEMFSELRDAIRALKDSSETEITPLDAEGWAILDAMADDLDRHIRAHFVATDPRVVDSLLRELSFKSAQLQVSLALYAVTGREKANTLGQIADKLVTVDNRVKTVGGLWAILREWFTRG